MTTILLLNLLWRGPAENSFRISSVLEFISADVWVPEPEEFLQPDHAVYGFGDGTFSLDREEAGALYGSLLDILRRQSGASSFLVSEVTPQQYREMMTAYRSIRILLPCAVPFGEFCDKNNINHPSSMDQIQTVESFILTAAAPESFFVEGGGQCWRLLSDSEEDVASVLLSVPEKTEPVYYTAGSMLGNENMALLPLAATDSLAAVSRRTESAEEIERAGRDMAEAIFGENFDFVRRITDSFGNVTYMYGYGEKTLTCLAEGSFEYKTDAAEGPDPGFYNSLQTAIAYIATHGGWGSDRRNLTFCLSGASSEGSGRSKLYTFEFAQVKGGAKLFSEDGPALTVKLSGGEVCYYRRAVVQADAAFGETLPAADAANVLAGNCHLIRSVLDAHLLTVSSDEEFSFVAQKFRSAYSAYAVEDDVLEPAWVIEMEGGAKFFFGLYDGVPLGFTRQ